MMDTDQPISQLSRTRLQKHNRLIKMIHSYKLTDKDKQNISQSKKQTEFQISMRYARSKHNHTYRFQHEENDDISDEQLEAELNKKETVKFDLRAQKCIQEKKVIDFGKFKTEEGEVSFKASRSISLKKIEPKIELMLTRREEEGSRGKYDNVGGDLRGKTHGRKGSEVKQKHIFPSLEKMLRGKQHQNISSSKMFPGGELKHKRLATEEVQQKSNSKRKFKLKTEQSLPKYGSGKTNTIGLGSGSTLSKAELLLLDIRPNQYKKNLFNKVIY